MRGLRIFFPVFFLSTLLPFIPRKARAQQQVTLGNATVPLTGPWKFHIGDNPAWAQPSFNDDAWPTMDLTPPPGSYDPTFGSSGYVPGWTARGYKGYSGYAWYRLRVNVQNGQTALALKMPDNFDDAYQVYVNGQPIGEFGRFTAQGVTIYNAQPRAFPLPANLHSGPSTLAIRMYMGPFSALVSPDAGGMHGPPVLGHAIAIATLLQMDWDAKSRSMYQNVLVLAVLLLAFLVSFGLFWLDRTEPAYLYLGLICAALIGNAAIDLAAVYRTGWFSGISGALLFRVILVEVAFGLFILFWAYWFRLGAIVRLHRVVWILVALACLDFSMLYPPLYGTFVSAHALVWLSVTALVLKVLLSGVLIWVAVRGICKDRVEGWLALLPVILVILSQSQRELLLLHVPTDYFALGAPFNLGSLAIIFSLLIETVLVLRRFLHMQQEREQWRLEIEQARQVQHMLIPEQLPHIPGLTIESEYRPARVVGGDFFQIVPDKTDGSVLIVVGDVTGHGLQAGMLVALIVGAIRSTAEMNADPMFVLNALNRRLCGRGHAHATCLALRIEADGAATLANAGHLPPYLNGKELPMEGALLLGMIEEAEFSLMNFHLREDDRLILMSDGIVEAQDAQGELFGFGRIQAMLQKPVTVAQVATAAQTFGQQDDISVLSVTRTVSSVVAFA